MKTHSQRGPERAPKAPSREVARKPEGSPETKPRRRRRRRKVGDRPLAVPAAPAAVVAQVAKAESVVGQDKWVEEPLTDEELALMRQHLRFLREHRKVLHLKVNAQEDLLLNEARLPTRRGVCQHLLAKVDRSRVFAAAERLEPAAATRLVEGVLRISPDVDYLLLYLDCVRRSASQEQAVLALSEALSHLDFTAISAAQLRRLLDLLVEVLKPQQRAQVLLALLSGRGFREAVDRAAAELPEALASLVVPLRAAHALVFQGKPSALGAQAAERGLSLLLEGEPRTLLRYPQPVRRRLLELGAQACAGDTGAVRDNLNRLLESFAGDEREHGELGIQLARGLIRSRQDAAGRELLRALAKKYPKYELPRRWLTALEAPRAGRLALSNRQAHSAHDIEQREAMALDTMERVSAFSAVASQGEALESLLSLWQDLTLIGVAPVLDSGQTPDGRALFAVPRFGRRWSPDKQLRQPSSNVLVLRWCSRVVMLLAGLARAGVVLPDVDPRRFEVTDAFDLWLTDLRGARRSDPEKASTAHLDLGKRAAAQWTGELLGVRDLERALQKCGSLPELVRLFAPFSA